MALQAIIFGFVIFLSSTILSMENPDTNENIGKYTTETGNICFGQYSKKESLWQITNELHKPLPIAILGSKNRKDQSSTIKNIVESCKKPIDDYKTALNKENFTGAAVVLDQRPLGNCSFIQVFINDPKCVVRIWTRSDQSDKNSKFIEINKNNREYIPVVLTGTNTVFILACTCSFQNNIKNGLEKKSYCVGPESLTEKFKLRFKMKQTKILSGSKKRDEIFDKFLTQTVNSLNLDDMVILFKNFVDKKNTHDSCAFFMQITK